MERTKERDGAGRAERWLALGFLVAGGLLVALSWLVQSGWSPWTWGSWASDFLLNLGAALVLIAPIEWFTATVRRDVARSDERQTQAVKDVNEKVNRLNAQVITLEELQRQVAEETEGLRTSDDEMFSSLGYAVSTDRLLKALERAKQRKLIGDRGVRVPIAQDAELRLRFTTESGPAHFVVVLETITGQERRRWTGHEGAEGILLAVADAIDGEGEPRQLDISFVFQRLAATIRRAAASQQVRPIIEDFPPQWALSEHGIVRTDHHSHYTVGHNAPNRVMLDDHVKRKSWVDYDSYDAAYEVACYLFPLTPSQQNADRARPS